MARKSAKGDVEDDTPRGFKRLMELKQRIDAPRVKKAKPAPQQRASLERRKGESMSDFSRRVDAAIPLPTVKGIDSGKTLRNAKKHKKKAENLRAEYKQKLEAKQRALEERQAGNEDHLFPDDDEDVWAGVNARAKAPKFGDVADRPPVLFKPKPNWNVPKSIGSESRRKSLEAERQKIIDFYRKKRNDTLLEEEEA